VRRIGEYTAFVVKALNKRMVLGKKTYDQKDIRT